MKIALIGYGYWGQKLLPYLKERFDVASVVTRHSGSAAQVMFDELIKAVVIATPIDTHYDIAMECILNDKHVFIEKPLAMKTKECHELICSAKYRKCRIAAEYTQTFSKGIRKFLQCIGKIGDVEFIHASTKHLGRFTGFDVHWLLSSHWLSVIDKIKSLDQFDIKSFGNNCTGTLLLSSNNLKVEIDVSLNHTSKEMCIYAYGSSGTCSYNYDGVVKYTSYTRDIYPKIINNRTYLFDEKNNLRFAVDYFYKLLRGKAESNIDTALRVTHSIERAGRI